MQECCVGNHAAHLDEIDRRLLTELQRDADRSLVELGTIVGLSPSAVSRRIGGYRRAGVIQHIVALADPFAVGVSLQVICQIVCIEDSTQALGALKTELLDLVEVVQCYEIAGNVDLIAVFAVPSMARYKSLTEHALSDNPVVRRFESHVVMETARPTARLPIYQPITAQRTPASGPA